MAEELTTGPDTGEGQAEIGSDGNQTTDLAPDAGGGGQSAEASQNPTTQQGPDAAADDSFFDPRDIQDKPELMSAYKGMQKAYTKKMQEISGNRQKIEAYDAFMNNPVDQLQRFAQQYGYHLTPAQAKQMVNEQQQKDWQPQSWDEVMDKATQRAKQELMQELSPVFSEVQHMKKQSIETQLSEIDPTWHQYEDQMKAMMREHPTLAKDPAKLYRLSVPQEVLESRATQAALRKLEGRQQSAQVAGGSTTTRNPQGGLPQKPVSFAQAVEAAKRKLAEEGIRPG